MIHAKNNFKDKEMEKITEVHIGNIIAGDTILHNGLPKTVCPKDISRGGFMGDCVFGDSYRLGTLLVKRITYHAK